MSACGAFTEHVWKPGECKNCFKPKSLHQLPAAAGPGPAAHGDPRTNANHSNNHRARAAGFRPPVAKKPTIAVKPTMMVAEGPGAPERGESKPAPPGWSRSRAPAGPQPPSGDHDDHDENNNPGEPPAGSGPAPPPGPGHHHGGSHGLAEVLKEVAGLGPGPRRPRQLPGPHQRLLQALAGARAPAQLPAGRRARGAGARAARGPERGRPGHQPRGRPLLLPRAVERGGERGGRAPGAPGGGAGGRGGRELGRERRGAAGHGDPHARAAALRQPARRHAVAGAGPGGREVEHGPAAAPVPAADLRRGLRRQLRRDPQRLRGRRQRRRRAQHRLVGLRLARVLPHRGLPLRARPQPAPGAVQRRAGPGRRRPGPRDAQGRAGPAAGRAGREDGRAAGRAGRRRPRGRGGARGGRQPGPRRGARPALPRGEPGAAAVQAVHGGGRVRRHGRRAPPPRARGLGLHPQLARHVPRARPRTARRPPPAVQRHPLPGGVDLQHQPPAEAAPGGADAGRGRAGGPRGQELPQVGAHLAHGHRRRLQNHPRQVAQPVRDQVQQLQQRGHAALPHHHPRRAQLRAQRQGRHQGAHRHQPQRLRQPGRLQELPGLARGAGGPGEGRGRARPHVRGDRGPEPGRGARRAPPEPAPAPAPTPAAGGHAREKASAALSQMVASIQPPPAPPAPAPAAGTTPPSAPARPKSLLPPQPGGEPAAAPEPAPPFPPPRSTSSPHHAAGSLLHRHLAGWARPAGAPRAAEAEAALHAEGGRRAADAKPKRWISFKSFFRRRKADEEEEREKERGKGKLVGLDGTVIHMLPPPPAQRHHWFAEARGEASEKPAIVFMYRCDPAQADSGGAAQGSAAEEAPPWGPEEKRSPRPRPPSPRAGSGPSHVTHEVPEGLSPQDPKTVPGKQDGTCVTPAPPAPDLEREEEKDDGSEPVDPNACSATYSNLGQSRAAMIPPKHPRQPKGASEDAIAFGERAEQEARSTSQATPPPLPKKTVIRANTEPLSRDLQRALESGLCVVANPTYDMDPGWDASSAGSSLSCDLRGGEGGEGGESGSWDSLERPAAPSTAHSARSTCSLAALGTQDRFSHSTESLPCRQARGLPKPQRQAALYQGLGSRDEVVGKIRSLHTEALKKLAVKCEDLFMAGQKDQLQFGVDSWSDFRLTSDKPCCEAGDAVYYTASYAKDPLNNYAVKICRGDAQEAEQYYHSLAVRQSLAVHFNIQQDCGHFLAEVPSRLLPWAGGARPDGAQRSHVVVITREVPRLTVADFVRDSQARHGASPDAYERQVCLLLLQLCAGLEHLKPHHVTHGDLRPENLLLVPAAGPGPARLLVSNFARAQRKRRPRGPEALREQARLAPEVLPGAQFRRGDEFQTGILVYELLHLPNPFAQRPGLRERAYSRADLPRVPLRSPYSRGLQRLAGRLLHPDPAGRLRVAEARAALQCLLWGPREDLRRALAAAPGPAPRAALLQNWLDVKRTLLVIRLAEAALERPGAVGLEDWLCAQYLAAATPDALAGALDVLQQP
ncbi:inactive tyrosine-protein kinase PEAK1 [Perognathus longimembris pacificus]|uniref:inactive tyrosine-protein kinase PEAK1 n=1 Tax=Perognathus longimembris pacificus TaxID=214514 RepID=UPI0020195507|nr:inactive tyrosine-protein kinase PEAK1 [Perognathus longimembris pacificus]